jgi:glycogenin glucosyltransferase
MGDTTSLAYVTVLSTDNYLDGVLVLDESLGRRNPAYPLHVVVTDAVSRESRRVLTAVGIPQIEMPTVDVPAEIRSANLNSDFHRHWAGVFDKLTVFSLCRFDKLVYLDSDMLILRNLDELFAKAHMSAVLADVSPTRQSGDLNAGLMVVEPQADLSRRLLGMLPAVYEEEKKWRAAAGRPPSMGVQALINAYWDDWIAKETLHLHPKFNVLTNTLDFYLKDRGRWRGVDGIHVLHFVGQTKPWMINGAAAGRHALRLLARRRMWEAVAFVAYRRMLSRARRRVRRAAVTPPPRS